MESDGMLVAFKFANPWQRRTCAMNTEVAFDTIIEETIRKIRASIAIVVAIEFRNESKRMLRVKEVIDLIG